MMEAWNGERSFQPGPGKLEREEGVPKRQREHDAACRQRLDDALDVALEDTFPASDAASITQPARCSHD